MNQGQPPQREAVPAANSPAAALVVWTLGQFILLAAIWGDFRLSANPAHTAGQLGLPLLLGGEVLLSTALWADLARTVRLTVLSFAISFPFSQLVGWRCASGAGVSLLYSAALALWLAALSGWMCAVRGDRSRQLLAAALMLWAAGTPVLWYLLAEFAPGSRLQNLIPSVSPLMALGRMPHLLILAAAHAALAGICAALFRRHAARA